MRLFVWQYGVDNWDHSTPPGVPTTNPYTGTGGGVPDVYLYPPLPAPFWGPEKWESKSYVVKHEGYNVWYWIVARADDIRVGWQ